MSSAHMRASAPRGTDLSGWLSACAPQILKIAEPTGGYHCFDNMVSIRIDRYRILQYRDIDIDIVYIDIDSSSSTRYIY